MVANGSIFLIFYFFMDDTGDNYEQSLVVQETRDDNFTGLLHLQKVGLQNHVSN